MSEKSTLTKSLFINTSSEVAVVAILDNEDVLLKTELPGRPDLSKNLKPKVEELLKKTNTRVEDICAVRVFPGPGSFTGLRIGISFANGLAYGLSVPVVPADEKGKLVPWGKGQVLPIYGSEPKITKPKN